MRAILVLLLLLATCGRATAVSGGTDTVRIDSVPQDATVTLDGRSYQTPVSLTLARGRSYDVTIQKEGFLTVRRAISQVGSNVVHVGSVLALAEDINDLSGGGCRFCLYPTDLKVELVPTQASERVYNRTQ